MEDHAGSLFSRALADEIRAEIAVQRKTASDLATALGIGAHTVGRRLSGSSPFSVVEMALTAEWLGIAPDALSRSAEIRAARERKQSGARARRPRATEAVAS